jgi:amidohydrolase
MAPHDLRERIQRVLPDIIALRHDLHTHPELSSQEERTARVVSEWLTTHGIPHETGVGGTHGVVAVIEGGAGKGKTIALRGDMDALPIQEENDAVTYKSQVPGVMHACGHDGHTANLMGAALVLNEMRAGLPGRVKLIFQPAEETVRGADALVEAGVVDDVDAIIMLHGWPHLAPGQIGVRNGPAMASADGFTLTIRGKGGHGAYPHDTIDPILVGAQLVTALQTIVSREVSPVAPAVVSVTTFHAGTAMNVIPAAAELSGTVRALDPDLRKTMPERLERVIAGICQALRAEYDFKYHFGTPVTVNDVGVSDLIRAVGRDLLGSANVIELPEPTMGAEDFAYYLEKVPGAMFRLGTGCPYLLHTPKYDFGDAPLETGILMMTELARRYLGAV